MYLQRLTSLLLFAGIHTADAGAIKPNATTGRSRTSLNSNWKFRRTETNPDDVIYDYRPDSANESVIALKPWILPSANDFIKDASKRYQRPSAGPNVTIPFAQNSFDDSSWDAVALPHDWAITGPFYVGDDALVGGGEGRLPSQGVAWYRRKLTLDSGDEGKTIYLDVDGAMSYAMVWLNGKLVGGWPYGYSSFRLDLTNFVKPGDDNLLAIRLDNPLESSRWYAGGGIYRNVWLTKVAKTHVAQWGTYVTTTDVSSVSATVDLVTQVQNSGNGSQVVHVVTDVHVLDSTTGQAGAKVKSFLEVTVTAKGGQTQSVNQSVVIENPQLWGPWPFQKPNRYVAVTRLMVNNATIDTYETPFGIRSVDYNPDKGLIVNGEHVRIQGVDQHHDLGAIGAAFNLRAAERQLEILREMGCNAIRTSHNPPAPELLDLTDRMGFVVLDEIFDEWVSEKVPQGIHLFWPEWHEANVRSFIRRDRNHPSVVIWSVGNEVPEQRTGAAGAAIAQELVAIAHEEDGTRQVTEGMNSARPNEPFITPFDIISLNYQGDGIRDTPAYSHLNGSSIPPSYPAFHAAYPEKMILSSETASSVSTRGTYFFPVVSVNSAPVNDTSGGNSTTRQVSAYELYSADWGASADKVFAAQDSAPYVAGEFVWSGFDYLGEPTPYESSRSSYFGIVDLAGFRKDRFYLYQARWNAAVKVLHILPHWTWPDRVGQVTPVHVFTGAEEVELFVNGKSQGRKRRAPSTYRVRWDNVTYEAGNVRAVGYMNGTAWANATVETAGAATQLSLTADRTSITADGLDLSYITVEVKDSKGNVVPEADNAITFTVSGGADIVATDNGNPYDFTVFPSKERKAFSGLALVIVRANAGVSGSIKVTASAQGLRSAEVTLEAQ